jgi:hypothetical protein
VRTKSEKSCDVDVMENHGSAAADCPIVTGKNGNDKTYQEMTFAPALVV